MSSKSVAKDLFFRFFTTLLDDRIHVFIAMTNDDFGYCLSFSWDFAQMIREAESLGANAIIGIRFGTSNVSAGAAEIIAYGTAVKI